MSSARKESSLRSIFCESTFESMPLTMKNMISKTWSQHIPKWGPTAILVPKRVIVIAMCRVFKTRDIREETKIQHMLLLGVLVISSIDLCVPSRKATRSKRDCGVSRKHVRKHTCYSRKSRISERRDNRHQPGTTTALPRRHRLKRVLWSSRFFVHRIRNAQDTLRVRDGEKEKRSISLKHFHWLMYLWFLQSHTHTIYIHSCFIELRTSRKMTACSVTGWYWMICASPR